MKSVQLYSGIAILLAALLPSVSAQEAQHALVDNTHPVLDPIHDNIILDHAVDDLDKEPVTQPIWSLCGNPSKHLLIPDEDGVTIDPPEPLVGANVTVTVKGQLLKRVTGGIIDIDLRLMKYIKITPKFDLCEQLEGDLFQESNASCPLEKGPVTLIAKKYIPEDVPKVSVQGNVTLTNQDGETLTCVHIDFVLKAKEGSRWLGIF